MKKVLIIWPWRQWQKYIRHFLDRGYEVYGLCKTEETQQKIQSLYKIPVFVDLQEWISHNPSLIILALPPDVQWEVALKILGTWFQDTLLIEIPVCWDKQEIQEILSYKNVVLFLEESLTLLARFLRRISPNSIRDVYIHMYVAERDYIDDYARKVAYIHVLSNFLWTGVDFRSIRMNFSFHDREDIFYDITFTYEWKHIKYSFHQEKSLLVDGRRKKDVLNFDLALSTLLRTETNNPEFYLALFDHITYVLSPEETF